FKSARPLTQDVARATFVCLRSRWSIATPFALPVAVKRGRAVLQSACHSPCAVPLASLALIRLTSSALSPTWTCAVNFSNGNCATLNCPTDKVPLARKSGSLLESEKKGMLQPLSVTPSSLPRSVIASESECRSNSRGHGGAAPGQFHGTF